MRPGELNPFHRQLLTRFLRNVAVALAVLLSVLALVGLSVAIDREADGGFGANLTAAIVVALATTVLVAGWTGPVALAACARWLWIKEKL